jgi:DNA modification methylase
MPEAVLERIIKASSKTGDLIVDPFCGTGTTAAVAHRLGRNFFTTDTSETYIKVAKKRIANQVTVDMMDSTGGNNECS